MGLHSTSMRLSRSKMPDLIAVVGLSLLMIKNNASAVDPEADRINSPNKRIRRAVKVEPEASAKELSAMWTNNERADQEWMRLLDEDVSSLSLSLSFVDPPAPSPTAPTPPSATPPTPSGPPAGTPSPPPPPTPPTPSGPPSGTPSPPPPPTPPTPSGPPSGTPSPPTPPTPSGPPSGTPSPPTPPGPSPATPTPSGPPSEPPTTPGPPPGTPQNPLGSPPSSTEPPSTAPPTAAQFFANPTSVSPPTPVAVPTSISFPIVLPVVDVEASSVATQSTRSSLLPEFAVDRDYTTRWASEATDDEWIYVRLAAKYVLQQVFLFWEAYGSVYDIQTSNDGSIWTTRISVTDGQGGTEVFDLPYVEAEYVRMRGIQRGTASGYSLFEFEVAGTALPPSPPPPTPMPTFAPVTVEQLEIVETAASGVETQNPTFVANNAIDGDYSTRWASERTDDQWIYFKLREISIISRVDLFWEAWGEEYDIQTSFDGESWTTRISQRDGVGGNETIDVIEITQYVRMRGLKRGTRFGYSLWEAEIYGFVSEDVTPPPTPVVPEILETVAATASSVDPQDPTLVAANVIDGDLSTRWASLRNNEDEWIYVELQSRSLVTRVDLYWEAAYGEEYDIQVSDDASSWNTVFSQTGGVGGNESLVLSSPEEANYVRMQGVKRGFRYGYSLYEMVVWGALS